MNYRQGDVLLIPIDEIPANLKKTKVVTLALGEVTGHHHTLNTGAIGYAEDEVSLADYIEVEELLADLTHQEHDTIQVAKGRYKVIRQMEYTGQSLRNVAD